jgi:hypothetical protein
MGKQVKILSMYSDIKRTKQRKEKKEKKRKKKKKKEKVDSPLAGEDGEVQI